MSWHETEPEFPTMADQRMTEAREIAPYLWVHPDEQP
jgi:hypothetical protein